MNAMSRKGLLFDIDYCTGCFACTVACKQENGYDADTWGIKVTELIFKNPGGHVQIDYLPFPTTMCTMCAGRIASGFDDKPSCVKHCQAQCIEYGEVSELVKKMEEKPRYVLYAPK
jgi:Fe-S-cluster-containing dehydrogenase component